MQFLTPRQRFCFFTRQRQHVVPTTELPPYEMMLRLDVRVLADIFFGLL